MCIITEICGHAANSREALCAQVEQDVSTDKDRTAETEWNLRAQRIINDFRSKGISISEWARTHGYDADLTRRILRGERAALRGQSHNIAVSLGIKDGEIVDDREMATAINA
ncbi:MAG: hypothetical protein AB7E32_17715 [Desulfovibrio sp.]